MTDQNDDKPTVVTSKEEFEAVLPLIRQEWPEVDADELKATEGDYDAITALVVEKTEHTKALVARQLDELRDMAKSDLADAAAEERKLQQMLKKMQEKTNEIASYVRSQMLADAKSKVGDNLLVSLLMAIGLGFIIGFILRGLGGRGRS